MPSHYQGIEQWFSNWGP